MKGIYRFINNRTSEVYVGQSNNVWARRAGHYKELKMGTHHNKGLQEDHDHGDKFTFEIVEEMPHATRNELEEREIYYIEKFNSFYEGYNQTPGGEYDKYKGKYENGGDRLPYYKYKPVVKQKPKKLGTCPECGNYLVEKKGRMGKFVGCSNYPKCRYWCSFDDLNKTKVKSKIPKVDYTSSIEWQTCKYCGHQINKVAKICPYCREPTPNNKEKSQNILKKEFDTFVTKKRNYLTKADCEYLSEKYEIDISNIKTVKRANTIIKKELKKENQWDSALKNLYNDKYSQNKPHITKKPKQPVKTNSDKESEVNNDETASTSVWYYEYLEKINKKEDKSEVSKKVNSKKHSINDFNYCSNCGFKIDSKDTFCSNCGEKIDKTISYSNNSFKQLNIENEKKSSRNWGELIATLIVIIIIIAFIFSLIILFADVEGPISSVAAFIVIGVVCFFCYSSAEGN